MTDSIQDSGTLITTEKSILLALVGIVWLLLLPYDGYSKRTYISENALLPGQVGLLLL